MNAFSIDSRLTNTDLIGLKECFAPTERVYERGEIITICSPEDDTIGIIKSGIAYLSTINSEEQRRIIDYYMRGNAFGKHFLPDTEEKLFYVYAKTKCTVDFVKYKKLITCCGKNCAKHVAFIDHIMMTTARKSLVHVDILCQRTLRSKLMSFFEYIESEEKSNSFTLPLPFSDLADYLGVDRSAMMREIKKLNEEKIISNDKRKVTINKK